MDYERDLLLREIKSILPSVEITEQNSSIIIDGISANEIDKLSMLTYISEYIVNGESFFTYQHLFENGNANTRDKTGKKQSTRYSTHGLHEYKGKYNPQVVRAIMNIIGIDNTCSVLDPFCGSGTTMLECLHVGVHSVGTDINPFAVFVSNIKLDSIDLNCTEAIEKFNELRKSLLQIGSGSTITFSGNNKERNNYLRKWIPETELNILERLLTLTKNMQPQLANFFKITASDLIRDYSYQEPSDLRIRRRISPFPNITFIDAWESNIKKYLHNISVIQKNKIPSNKKNYAIEFDIRNADVSQLEEQFDAAITSPPYATALPYIDTQRISLVWLGLCSANEILPLESSLIGSREFCKLQKSEWNNLMQSNSISLPTEIYNLIIEMQNTLSESDGFRKKAVPLLLYRYFSDMKSMFNNLSLIIKKDGYYCLIVGHNKSTISGKTFNVDTPKLLSILAENCGWNVCELIPLQTYKRYGLNVNNSINHETLIILKKAGD